MVSNPSPSAQSKPKRKSKFLSKEDQQIHLQNNQMMERLNNMEDEIMQRLYGEDTAATKKKNEMRDDLLIWMDENLEDPAVMSVYTKPIGFINRENRNAEELEADEQRAVRFYGMKPTKKYLTPLKPSTTPLLRKSQEQSAGKTQQTAQKSQTTAANRSQAAQSAAAKQPQKN